MIAVLCNDPGAAEALESGDELASGFSSAAVFSQSSRRSW